MTYTFMSPIQANRDAVEAKCKAKAGVTNKKTMKYYEVKDKAGTVTERVIEKPDDKTDKYKDKTITEKTMYIVESTVKP